MIFFCLTFLYRFEIQKPILIRDRIYFYNLEHSCFTAIILRIVKISWARSASSQHVDPFWLITLESPLITPIFLRMAKLSKNQ